MRVLSKGQEKTLLLAGFDEASRAGQHLSAARSFIRTNDIDRLKPFEGLSVKDTAGRSHPLENDPNALHRIFAAGDEFFHDVYRLTI